ncbi:MAG: B12-binding domain-containing radical SAM protein [Planctomycetota bacterium]
MSHASNPKYKHAVCLFPYHRHLSGINFFPPTGLEYIAGAMQGYVGKVSLIDLSKDRKVRTVAGLVDFIRKEGVDLVCASLNWDYNADKGVEILKSLPEEIPLVVGGQTATKDVEELLGGLPNILAVVRGEGEETIREIAEGKPLDSILGLSFRKNGEMVHNANRPLPPAAALPNPDRSLRRCRYRVDTLDIPMLRGDFDAILASRGCPFHCKFCTFSMNPLGQKRKYSSRPVESVLEELETVEAEYVIFSDDYFFVEPARTKKLCQEIARRGLQRHFIVNARLDVAKKPDMLEAARAAGVKVLLIGIESATDRILDQLNKGITTEQIRKYMPVLRSFGFFNHGYFIYGNLGETEAEMMNIPRFAREIGLDSITLSKLRAEKFSPIHDDVANTEGAWVGSTGFVYQKGMERKDLKRIGKAMQKAFYTPGQMNRIVRKALDLELLQPVDILRLIALSPVLVYAFARRMIEHRRHKK